MLWTLFLYWTFVPILYTLLSSRNFVENNSGKIGAEGKVALFPVVDSSWQN